MKIVTDTPMCSLCNTYLENIPHIYLHCIHTNSFIKLLEDFIKKKVDRNYKDPTKTNFIVCNHTSQIINYFNIVAKWYISKRFQAGEMPIWQGYIKLLKLSLTGDKIGHKSCIVSILAD